ncbi:MAG: MHS family MFS transporter [Opitutae bacterium]|nr:MHS family MFS transporter [Opitutae bacterium]
MTTPRAPHAHPAPQGIWKVIAAASAGTLIEWYDFYIFGSLSAIISTHFFPKEHPTAAFLSTLAVFATGFIVRPFGALVFGRLGDLVGRKYTFLVTLVLMGGATFLIGLLPGYEQIGLAAPVLLVVLRLVQGLALGGEYGGAATYVAEHAPDGRRGFYTSFIQTTATLGLFVSLGVILLTRQQLGKATFEAWGWRLPFLLSIFLVLISYYIRVRMEESPMFAKAKAAGRLSASPLRESFLTKDNRRLVLLALFGATAGQGVVWYTGQFYALFFLQGVGKVEFVTANVIVAVALVLGTPFFVFFGSLSDRIGRKPIILAGCLLAAVFYVPIYRGLVHFAHPLNATMLVALVLLQVLFVTMVYGPIAAFLVELFPTRIRYTSMSLPYHIGNGVFGGLVPFIASALVVKTGNIYMGLAYPITVAAVTFVVGATMIKERRDVKMADE